MNDCSKEQACHAVVITENQNQKDSWDFYPSMICVNIGDTVSFFIQSHLTGQELVTIDSKVSCFFTKPNLSTKRNTVLEATVMDEQKKGTTICIVSGSNLTADEPVAPILKVKVRR